MGPRLRRQLAATPGLRDDARTAALYLGPDGAPRSLGERLANPALAAVMQRIAQVGPRALLQGAVAADIEHRVQGHATRPGGLALADLAGYQPLEREPLCHDWRAHRVCGFPPPSSGGLAVAQMLGLLEALGPVPAGEVVESLHRFIEASKLAFADRARHVGDPAFVPAPGGDWRSLLSPVYLHSRAQTIGPRSRGLAEPGEPPQGGTTHLSVADAEGGVVALTSSIEAAFGSHILSDGGTGLPGGFFLNNQLTDFAAVPRDAQGRWLANRVQPGARPRSSMSPTIVFDRASGQPVLVLGSALGPFIIPAVARVIQATLGDGVALDAALAQPLVASLNGPVFVEAGRLDDATLAALRERGHSVQASPLASGLHALQRVPGGWLAAADPRREGEVRGD